eukprot:5382709-Pleurochrysis_carterae.AAC.1
MAGRSAPVVTLVPKGQEPEEQIDAELAAFMVEVNTVHDAEKLSSVDQIARLHRPGAKSVSHTMSQTVISAIMPLV